jgi:ATP-dependent exoDNAse (exonuclease V) alpha subunit
VIVVLPPGRLLDLSWLYTAVTRASALAIIVGEAGTIAEAWEPIRIVTVQF